MPSFTAHGKLVTALEIRRCFTRAELLAVIRDARTNDETALILFQLATRGAQSIPTSSASLQAALAHLQARNLAPAKLVELLSP